METLLIIAIVVFVVMNFGVCILVMRSNEFDPIQKKLQMLVVWLLPVIGNLLVGFMLWSLRRREANASASTGDHSQWEGPPGTNPGEHHGD
jgi:cytochrome c-type biogenesis protein CcmH/NrfF